jgi:hypothetical protein
MGQDDGSELPPRANESEAEAIAAHLDDHIEEVGGLRVRADAGEDGSVWLALRGGLDDQSLASDVLEAIEEALEDDVPGLDGAFSFKISMGVSGNDLAFKCEFFRPGRQTEDGADKG